MTPIERVREALEDIVHAAFEHGNKGLSGKTLDPDGELLGAAKEALSELEGMVLVKDWQPIETAPPVCEIIITNFYDTSCAYKNSNGNWVAQDPSGGGQCFVIWSPTHWMPLPAAPHDRAV